MKYTVSTIVCGAYQENAYLLCPEGTPDALLIDPGDDLSALRGAVAASGRKLAGMLLTHGHFDHILGAQPLAEETGAAVYCHPSEEQMLNSAALNAYDPGVCAGPCPDAIRPELYGEELALCGLRFFVLHTPGHTPGSVCLYDPENGRLFAGDTLFCAGFGRCDLPGGSMRAMRASLYRLFELPEDTHVYSGHGPDTTIGMEKRRYHL